MVMNAGTEAYLTPKEVARILMVSVAAVRHWAEKGELRARMTPGGHRRYIREDVERFAQKRNLQLHRPEQEAMRILVVDDDRQFAGCLGTLLKKFEGQVEVATAFDGFEAGLKLNEFHPDVVLLDIMMDGINGIEVCRKIKSHSSGEKIRVIAMTGYPSDENVGGMMEAGAEVCMQKPISRDELLHCLGLGENRRLAGVGK